MDKFREDIEKTNENIRLARKQSHEAKILSVVALIINLIFAVLKCTGRL